MAQREWGGDAGKRMASTGGAALTSHPEISARRNAALGVSTAALHAGADNVPTHLFGVTSSPEQRSSEPQCFRI